MNIYHIPARAMYPVCQAGAVVIANTPEKALALANDLLDPGKPEFLGISDETEERIVISNNGDY